MLSAITVFPRARARARTRLYGGQIPLCQPRNRTHGTGHNELQRRQFTAPIFTGFGVEVRVRSAATQQRVALKEPINDLFGVRFVVVDSRIRKFPQLDKAKARRNHGFALFLIHSRPFRCGVNRL